VGITKPDYQYQTTYFGHQHGTEYSVLVLDNLGVGESDKPYSPSAYSTSNMAQNILEIADHLGWTQPRQLHIGGGSMGGMICQEIGLLVPDRIASLTPWSTTGKFENVGSSTAKYVIRILTILITPRSMDTTIQESARRTFPLTWLEGPDVAELPKGNVPKCRVPEGGYQTFDNNYARWAATEAIKKEVGHITGRGFWLQGAAAGTHFKSPEQLKELGDRVGRERIAIIHGDEDEGIHIELGRRLIQALQPAKSIIVEKMGHQPFQERPTWFNAILEGQFKLGEELSGRAD
jgi:pimeloyl-ACP methyl ester carboxylesterase